MSPEPEIPIRQRMFWLIPVRNAVEYTGVFSLPKCYILPAADGARKLGEKVASARYEFPAEGGKVAFAGQELTVPAGALPDGSRVTVHYPYTPPGKTTASRYPLHCFKLEVEPGIVFSKPAEIHLVAKWVPVTSKGFTMHFSVDHDDGKTESWDTNLRGSVVVREESFLIGPRVYHRSVSTSSSVKARIPRAGIRIAVDAAKGRHALTDVRWPAKGPGVYTVEYSTR